LPRTSDRQDRGACGPRRTVTQGIAKRSRRKQAGAGFLDDDGSVGVMDRGVAIGLIQAGSAEAAMIAKCERCMGSASGPDDAAALGIAGFVIALDAHDRTTALKVFFDPLNYPSYNALAISYLQTGQFADAHEVATRSIRLNPRFSVSRAFLVAALSRLGRLEEATGEVRRLLDIDSAFSIGRFSVTVEIEPAVFLPLAEAWRRAGLPAH
jgi:tetratricopeptide (TPR) repeat protein